MPGILGCLGRVKGLAWNVAGNPQKEPQCWPAVSFLYPVLPHVQEAWSHFPTLCPSGSLLVLVSVWWCSSHREASLLATPSTDPSARQMRVFIRPCVTKGGSGEHYQLSTLASCPSLGRVASISAPAVFPQLDPAWTSPWGYILKAGS